MTAKSRALMVVALLVSFPCSAEESIDPAVAAESVLGACLASASTGEPVDIAKVATYFKADRSGRTLMAKGGLPSMKLMVDSKGTFRCVLMGKKEVGESAFAQALSEKMRQWPGFELKPLKSVPEAYLMRGDDTQGLHGVVVTVEITDMGVWTVMVWDTGLPAAKPTEP